MRTDYPWSGDVQLTVTPAQPIRFELALRIPRWCRDFRVEVNGAVVDQTPERGYVVIDREWQTGDTVTLMLTMPVERILSHPHARHSAGCAALQRGPIIYCLEEVGNGAALAGVTLPADARLAYRFDDRLFGGVGTISGEALRSDPARWSGDLYQPETSLASPRMSSFTMKAIPYCFRANRQPGEMRVWIRKA